MYELSGQAEGVDWTDVAMAGRAYADNVVGEPAITASMHRMAAEIERLRGYRDAAEADCTVAVLAAERMRLTDAEREAVAYFAEFYASPREGDARHADTLRGLLERTNVQRSRRASTALIKR